MRIQASHFQAAYLSDKACLDDTERRDVCQNVDGTDDIVCFNSRNDRSMKDRGVFCIPRYIQKPAFECQVFTDRKTFGKSQFPYSHREREDGTKIVYDTKEYPGTMQGLERVVVLPWNEFYTEDDVRYIADAVIETARQLRV